MNGYGLQSIVTVLLLSACVTGQKVSYRQDVYPVLARNCLECHQPPSGEGFLQTRLSLETYDSLMKGTQYGPVVMPGDSRRSILNILLEGRADFSVAMPHQRANPLSQAEVQVLRLWVEQGARNN